MAEEYWGEELTGKDSTPIPYGPSIIAWDNDCNNKPSNVEIILDEQDQVDESLSEATNIVSKTVIPEQATTVRTQSMARSNPLPSAMIKSRLLPGTILQDDDLEDEDGPTPLNNDIKDTGYLSIIGGWDGTNMDITLHGQDTYTPIIGG